MFERERQIEREREDNNDKEEAHNLGLWNCKHPNKRNTKALNTKGVWLWQCKGIPSVCLVHHERNSPRRESRKCWWFRGDATVGGLLRLYCVLNLVHCQFIWCHGLIVYPKLNHGLNMLLLVEHLIKMT